MVRDAVSRMPPMQQPFDARRSASTPLAVARANLKGTLFCVHRADKGDVTPCDGKRPRPCAGGSSMSRRSSREQWGNLKLLLDSRDLTHRCRRCLCNIAHVGVFESGPARWRRSCHSMNRDRAGPCSASAPTGVAFVRLNIFSDARRAAALSTRAIWHGSRSTKVRCHTPLRIKRSSSTELH